MRTDARQAMSPAMDLDLIITCVVIVLALGMTVFAGWKSGRPHKDTHKTQWISWPLVCVLSAAVLVFAVIHGMNLFGMHTGQGTLNRLGL